jgi:UPF0176 protein
MNNDNQIDVAAFYVFQPLADHTALRAPILALFRQHKIKGMLLLAAEGLNGTLAGKPDDLRLALEGVATIAGTGPLPIKLSHAPSQPFRRMKVRLKTEIVTIGDTSIDPRKRVGTYVEPEDWNALLADPDIVLVDARNSFEVEFGTFRGAVDPRTTAFSEFPAFVKRRLDPGKHRKVAMFCTGGIRCEKASSYLLQEGFEQVFHLKGGILAYLERVKADDSLWEGSCFVFDERVALEHGLKVADVHQCFSCDRPVATDDRLRPEFEEGVSCPACFAGLSDERKASARERQRQVVLARKRGKHHLGPR